MKMLSVALPEACSETQFRAAARSCLAQKIEPDRVLFASGDSRSLFDQLPEAEGVAICVPRAFHDLVGDVLCHSADDRFALLYRLLWRIHQGERHLLDRASDPDVIRVSRYAKAVKKDVYRMHAFVRFSERRVEGAPMFVAWFEPEHRVLERAAPFFVDRFTNMNWIIATPFATAIWKARSLAFAPPGPRPATANDPVLDEFWTTFYRVTFNPARLRVGAMLAQMPKRHWPTMPETRLVPNLIQSAGTRVDVMTEQTPEPPPKYALALERHPLAPRELAPADEIAAVRRDAEACTRCPLYGPATQLVFGEGPADASLMFVGEQPGDQEDLDGRPFVGPAGQVFDRALAAAGIVREDTYVTGAVKHFKFEPRGKRRIHSKPGRTEVVSCRHWLDREIAIVRPKLVVALGATAAFSLSGRPVAVTKERGSVCQLGDLSMLVTLHPSYILRITDPDAAARAYDDLVSDLKLANRWLNGQSHSEMPQLAQAS
jgi:uracil-DNA glycosylase